LTEELFVVVFLSCTDRFLLYIQTRTNEHISMDELSGHSEAAPYQR
jgi:hypothetical protein